jgi:regulatory protein
VAPKTCHERALGLLAARPRTRWELDQRLRRAGFEADEVADVLARLEGVGLINDRDFAQTYAEHAFGVKHAGARAVTVALTSKGIGRELVEEVTAQEPGQEDSRAAELASRAAGRLRGLDQPKAFVRLSALLMRRGFSPETARRAARRALQVADPD